MFFGREAMTRELQRPEGSCLLYGGRHVGKSALLQHAQREFHHPEREQLFCHELLTKLQERPDGDTPPYSIEQSGVEDAYRNRKVRESLREQFESTLAPDPHYQALVWTMVLEQRRAGEGSSHAYTPEALWRMAPPSWPRGENPLDETQLRGLLDEMCGLGVLGRNGDGQYRLRNPNLRRLLGADIEDRLLKLAQP